MLFFFFLEIKTYNSAKQTINKVVNGNSLAAETIYISEKEFKRFYITFLKHLAIMQYKLGLRGRRFELQKRLI